MTATLDLNRLMAEAKTAVLAAQVVAEAEDPDRASRAAELDVLRILVCVDIAPLILQAAQVRGVTVVLERWQRAVLWADPTVDLTADVLAAYDAVYEREVARLGLPCIKAHLHERLGQLRRKRAEERAREPELNTGQYL